MDYKNFNNHWNLEMAVNVMENKTVDSKLWSEAVEWLLLYGPLEIKDIILEASGMATNECFPNLKATGFTADGQPCYDVKDLADSLGVPEQEVAQKIADIENQQDIKQLFGKKETRKIQ